MKKGIWLAVLAVALMATVIIVPVLHLHSPAPELPAEESVSKPQQRVIKKTEKDTDKKVVLPQSDTEQVTFFVRLNEKSVIDAVIESGGYPNVRSYLLSDAGRTRCDAIVKSQAVARTSIRKLVPKADLSGSRTFSALWNAITVRAPLNAKASLEKINGIASAEVLYDDIVFMEQEETGIFPMTAETDEAPLEESLPEKKSASDESNEEEQDASGEGLNRRLLTETYRTLIHDDREEESADGGRKMLIAVLDSEFEVFHPFFGQMPSSVALTQEELSALYGKIGFQTSVGANGVYVNRKIAFAYDYAGNDTDLRDEGLFHGTPAAAIAAGCTAQDSTISYRGIAWDAQLVLMKIADSRSEDGRILVRTDAALAALDDAVKLGVDVVNLSCGTYESCRNEDLYLESVVKMQQIGICFVCAAGNNGPQGADKEGKISAEDIFYAAPNRLSLAEGVLSAGAADHLVTVKQYFEINGTRIYYKDLTPLTLRKQMPEPEQPPKETSEQGSEETSEEAAGDSSSEESAPESSLPQESSLSGDSRTELQEETSKEEASHEEKPETGHRYLYFDTLTVNNPFLGKELKERLIILNGAGTRNLKSACEEAFRKGAAAVALMNTDEIPEISSNYAEKAVLIRLEENFYDILVEQPEGLCRIDAVGEAFEKKNPVRVSGFTAYSGGEELSVGSRLIAPGQEVYTAGEDAGEGYFTGTSAAAPCISGAYALVKQYLDGTRSLSGRSSRQICEITQAVLLSHGSPLEYVSDGTREKEQGPLYESPRQQGFGMVNLSNALTAGSYLVAEGGQTEGICLGEGTPQEYAFQFKIVHFGEEPVTYRLSAVWQTDCAREEEGGTVRNTLQPESLYEHITTEFLVKGEPVDSVTLRSGENQVVMVRMTVNQQAMTEKSKLFPAGFYLDGYVFLTEQEGKETMNLPVSGFYGLTEELSPFDHTVNEQTASISDYENGWLAVAFKNDHYESCRLMSQNGHYLFSKNALQDELEDSSYSSAVMLPDFYLLRNVVDFTVSVQDLKGKTLYSENYGAIPSGRSASRLPFEMMIGRCQKLQQFFAGLSAGTYRYEVSARAVKVGGGLTEPFRCACLFDVDNEKPKDVKARTYHLNGTTYLELTASDKSGIRTFVLYATAYDEKNNVFHHIDALDEFVKAGYISEDAYVLLKKNANEDGSETFLYDISNLRRELRKLLVRTSSWSSPSNENTIAFKASDGAYNMSDVLTADTLEYGTAEFLFADQNGRPAEGIRVTIGGKSAVSDKTGSARFERLEPDYYYARITGHGTDYTLSSSVFLVDINLNRLNFQKKCEVTFEGEYSMEESSQEEASVPESSLSSGESSERSGQSPTDTRSSRQEDADNPLTAILFVGVLLVVNTTIFIIRKRTARLKNGDITR